MTTPANPAPEPDGAKKSAPTTEYMVRWIRDDAKFERSEKLHGIAKFYDQIADRLESQQTDLSDTRRRLAEVEKERDEALAECVDLEAAEVTAKRKLTALRNAADGMRLTLERIARWFGEFPELTEKWPDGSVMTYGAAYGSNGERDYMRQIAQTALAAYAALISEGEGKETSL